MFAVIKVTLVMVSLHSYKTLRHMGLYTVCWENNQAFVYAR